MKTMLFFILFFVASAQAEIINGVSLTAVTLEQALADVRPGSVLVLGELHYSAVVADNQVQVLETLRKNGLKVSVGMEFYSYPDQGLLDSFRAAQLTEPDFLQKIGWGKLSFDGYRRQTLFPDATQGSQTLALNAPRDLTGKIAKTGMDSLSEIEKALLPPDLTRGNANYFERFTEIMGGHVSAAKLENYFMAQSTWDETMAWSAQKFVDAHPDQVLVVIVGEFHVQYGGGLPDRMKARGIRDIHTLSFVNLHGLTADQVTEELSPAGKYGPRADVIWTTDFIQ